MLTYAPDRVRYPRGVLVIVSHTTQAPVHDSDRGTEPAPHLMRGQALSDSEGSKVLVSIPTLQDSDQVIAEGF